MCQVELQSGGVPISSGLERAIVDRIAWLEKSCPELTQCRVTIDGPAPHHHGPYRVRLDLFARDLEIEVTGHAEPQMSRAMSSAFDHARTRLADKLAWRRRGARG